MCERVWCVYMRVWCVYMRVWCVYMRVVCVYECVVCVYERVWCVYESVVCVYESGVYMRVWCVYMSVWCVYMRECGVYMRVWCVYMRECGVYMRVWCVCVCGVCACFSISLQMPTLCTAALVMPSPQWIGCYFLTDAHLMHGCTSNALTTMDWLLSNRVTERVCFAVSMYYSWEVQDYAECELQDGQNYKHFFQMLRSTTHILFLLHLLTVPM